MTASRYPFLFATLGDAAASIPDELAQALETTLSAPATGPTDNGFTLLGCLKRIRQGEGADGQPWPSRWHTPGQRVALARIDRANAGLILLLEMLHASERVRVDGEEVQQIGDDIREGLLLACRGLSEYMGTQLPAV
ncbi:hypothetical protein CR919_15720 [Stenotrophomonas sp. LMG 10879]|uniref:hypothetical protein n=1 Tax=unclassified Stenotrophomonas TaxID=196198 RepID=UPI000C195116|nr:hypothetical protein [Stenotrophomonas sp. LMG 10879]PII18815.1 hypothetical protein CR919_15720 [Stenotrophomonas sp. LMG 10879]